MKILSAHIYGFGKFSDLRLTFTDGVNIIHGRNEAGKSTLHSFIEAMLLGPNRKSRGFSRSVYDSMEPWDEKIPYGGSLKIEHAGSVYRIERNFRKGQESLLVFDETAGQIAGDPQGVISRALEDLTPDAYRNSISIGQLSAKTGAALQKELKGYVENVGGTASPDLNAGRAVEYLKERKETLKAGLSEDAAKDYAASLSRIKNIESELNRPENDNHIRMYETQRRQVKEALSRNEEELSALSERIEHAARTLSDNRITGAKDVEELDMRAERLYEEYGELEIKKKSPARTAGIVIAALVFFAAAAGVILRRESAEWIFFIIGAAAALAVLVILAVSGAAAASKFRKKESELLSFMKNRNGASSVNDETFAELKRCIHSYDELLLQKEEDELQKTVLSEERSSLLKDQSVYADHLEAQQKIRFNVENRLSEENRLRNRAAQLRAAIAENNRIKEQIDAIDIAIDTICDLSDTIRDRLGTYLNKEASRALESITDGHYRAMDIGTGSDISLNSSLGMISVADVSAGTIDQVYLAVRLAAARFMMHGGDKLPLIFDDSFALYDDARHKRAVNFIADDYRGQILMFTCHRREEAALSDKPHNLIEL